MSKPEKRKQPLILSADDDPTIRFMMEEALVQAGYQVETAVDGSSAVQRFKTLSPDLILLDVEMPGMDGFSVCRAIRSLPEGADVPITMVTSRDDLVSIEAAYRAGATDFLTKPVHWALLGHRMHYAHRAGRAFRDLKASESRQRALLQAVPDMILRMQADGRLIDVQASGNLTDKSPDELREEMLEALFPADTASKMRLYMRRAVETKNTLAYEFVYKVKEQDRIFETRMVSSGEDELIAIIRDVTEQREAEKKVYQMAYFDALTGLSNRHAFRERFEYMVKESLRQRNQIALLFIDLDHFKRINDTYGHTFGDELLQQFSARLVKAVRETDDICLNSDVEGRADIARLGGDEFVIRLSKLDDAMLVATSVAERIRRAVKEPFEIDGHTIYITTSIGISIYPTDGHDTETLMRNADIAMYQAKAHGRNKFAFYTERTNTHAHIRLNLESELHAALEKELLDVYYQPIIDARTFAVTAAETLVRWLHPERGVIPAFEFISIAEEMGLITQIDDIVFRKACAQLAAWHQEGHKLERIFVNFSGNQFQKPDLVDYVSGILQEHNLTGRNLVIEITEGVLAESEKRLLDITQSLRDMGVRLAIDDFGTGYSSLSRLKNLALDKLKIDHSFVRGLGEDEESGALIKAIVAMARSLKMQVVAEGVETEIQLDRLLNYGVDCLQGYYFSPAVPAEEFVRLFGTGYAGRKLIAAS